MPDTSQITTEDVQAWAAELAASAARLNRLADEGAALGFTGPMLAPLRDAAGILNPHAETVRSAFTTIGEQAARLDGADDVRLGATRPR